MGIEGNIRKFYLMGFFGLLNFYGPVFVLFFQSFGFSLAQIFFLLSVYSITVILLEMPTGIFSDYIGRKKTLLLSYTLDVVWLLIMVAGSDYIHFIAAYFIMGIASSLASGTENSIIYDSLAEAKRKKDYKKVYGKYTSSGQIALTVGALLGGYFFLVNLRLPYLLTAAAYAIAVFIMLTMKEPSRKALSMQIKKHVIGSINTLTKNRKLAYIALFSVLVHVSIVLSWFFVQPYYKSIGLGSDQIGVALAVGYMIVAISSFYAHVIERRLGGKSLLLVAILIILGYFLGSQLSFSAAFAVFYLISVAQGTGFVVLDDYMNSRIKPNNRATVLSVRSFISNVVISMVAPLMGYLSDAYSVQTALLIMALSVLLISIAIIPKIKR